MRRQGHALRRRYGRAGGPVTKAQVQALFEKVKEADRANQRVELKLAYPGKTKKTHSQLWKSAATALERLKALDKRAMAAQAAYREQHGKEWWEA